MKKQFKLYIIVITLLVQSFTYGQAQANQFSIKIDTMSFNLQKNWLGIPQKGDGILEWSCYEHGNKITNLDTFEQVKIILWNESKSTADTLKKKQKMVEIRNLSIEDNYSISLFGEIKDVPDNVFSDTLNFVIGSGPDYKANGISNINIGKYQPWNGSFVLALLGKEYVYFGDEKHDGATMAGRRAFDLLWYFFLVGVFIIVPICFRRLSLVRILPVKPWYKAKRLSLSQDKNYYYRKNKTFEKILEEWKELIINTNKEVQSKIISENITTSDGILEENIKYWKLNGVPKIEELKCKLKKLENIYMNSECGDNETNEESHTTVVQKDRKELPTVQIIRAGLDNHEFGGYRWLEVSEEVDRAIENRANAELETLRRKSYIDWLWNLGTLAPLVGLFGTASGISESFSKMEDLSRDGSIGANQAGQNQMIQELSGGIYEALWTTIFGLTIGIAFMLIYFYYNNKLNWIYAKWEEMYVWISEKL